MNQQTYQSYQARVQRLEAARRGFSPGNGRILAEAGRLRGYLADGSAPTERHVEIKPDHT